MYKTVQAIAHPKIGLKNIPTARLYFIELQSIQLMSHVWKGTILNICEGALYLLLSFPAVLTSCLPAQSH